MIINSGMNEVDVSVGAEEPVFTAAFCGIRSEFCPLLLVFRFGHES